MMLMAVVFLFAVEYSTARYLLVEMADKVDGTIAGLERISMNPKGISNLFLCEAAARKYLDTIS